MTIGTAILSRKVHGYKEIRKSCTSKDPCEVWLTVFFRWAIHRNERDFPDADRFNPERYIKDSPCARPFPNEKGYMTFGWGRRVCSGQGLAEQGTFISIARMLWAFRIEKAKDANGKDIPVDIFAYT